MTKKKTPRVNRMTLPEAAKTYARAGWSVLPIHPNEKRPLTKHGYKDATRDESKIRETWRETPDANIGIATGEVSGILVVDVDVKNGAQGMESVKSLALNDTLSAKTPSGGRHIVFEHPGKTVRGRNGLLPGIDIKTDGGYVLVAPSVIDGNRYHWTNTLKPQPMHPDVVRRLTEARTEPADLFSGPIPKGRRNDTLFRLACILRDRGLDESAILKQLVEENERCTPPLGGSDLARIASSACRYEPRAAALAAPHGETKRVKHSLVEALEPWQERVNGDELVVELVDALLTYVDLPRDVALAVALWVLHTWLVEESQVSPMLAITSPQRGCGKTTVLKLLNRLVCRPLIAANISPAAVFRVIEQDRPTLLIDEADSFLKDNEPLRNVLNASHDRENAFVIRCEGDAHEPRRFSVFGAKAIALIGKLHATLMDRSIEVRMQKTMKRKLKKLTVRDVEPFRTLQRKCARWAQDNAEAVRRAAPQPPEALLNRSLDNWFELLRIACVIGKDRELCRIIEELIGNADDTDVETKLLADLRDIFDEENEDELPSELLVMKLNQLEGCPWPDMNQGRGLSASGLAERLAPYDVKPKQRRRGASVKRGYLRTQLEPIWKRYLPPRL